jgi:putative transposase
MRSPPRSSRRPRSILGVPSPPTPVGPPAAGHGAGSASRHRSGRAAAVTRFGFGRKRRNGNYSIRIGDGHPRSVTLPTIGNIRVHDDTRPLRRLLRPVQIVESSTGEQTLAPRAKVLFATVARHAGRWYVCLTVLAPDIHQDRRHPPQDDRDRMGYVGVDRGLRQFAVAATADGTEVGRWPAPRPLTRRLQQVRGQSKALSRKKRGSSNRAKAVRRLSRGHARIADVRRTFLHQVTSQLAKTHGKLAIEDLQVTNLVANRRLARALGDVGWGIFARQLAYTVRWLGGELVVCDRWFPSTRTCYVCGTVKRHLKVAERTFRCHRCGNSCDRDRNAAANLAAWAERSDAPDRQAGGRVNNVPGGNGAGHRFADGGSVPDEGGTDAPAIA